MMYAQTRHEMHPSMVWNPRVMEASLLERVGEEGEGQFVAGVVEEASIVPGVEVVGVRHYVAGMGTLANYSYKDRTAHHRHRRRLTPGGLQTPAEEAEEALWAFPCSVVSLETGLRVQEAVAGLHA